MSLRAAFSILGLIMLAALPARAGSFTEDFSTTTFRDPATTADWNTGAGELRLFPLPQLVTEFDTPGFATEVAVAGDHAYLADQGNGLLILDISDPANPVQTGSFDTAGLAYGVAVAGDLACVADGLNGLVILDVSGAFAPVQVGILDTPGAATAVALAGRRAYVADGGSGLQIIDVADPTAPVLLGSYDTAGEARHVAIAGQHAYVADRAGGLVVLDVADPADPVLVATVVTSSQVWGVAVDGTQAFVCDLNDGIRIYDVSDPTSPVPLGELDTPGQAVGIDVSGDRVLVADAVAGLQVVDVTDSASPVLLGGINTSGSARRVAHAGNLAFLAGGQAGLQVLQLARHVPPEPVGSGPMPVEPFGFDVAGDLAAVATYGDGLHLFDVSDPGAPVPAGTFGAGTYLYSVALDGNLAFVGTVQAGLQILDISDPSAPSLIGTQGTPGDIWDVAVDGHLALVSDGSSSRLRIYDVSDPAQPIPLGVHAGGDRVFGIAVDGNVAYLATRDAGLQILDISDPASPVLLGTHPTADFAYDVAIDGDLAFVAARGAGLEIVDVTNVAAPTVIGSYPVASAYRVVVSGNLALLSDYDNGIHVLDVSDPASPLALNGFNRPGAQVDVALAGEFAFVASRTFDPGTGELAALRLRQYAVDTARDAARSTAVDGGDDAILRARIAATQTGVVAWELSADGGASFQPFTPAVDWTEFANPGNDLVWRAALAPVGGVVPVIADLTIEWLHEFAPITAVTDIPDDQGRQVRVAWRRSGHDFAGDPDQITGYAVYRRIDQPAAKAPTWDHVVSVPVLLEDEYAVVVPTLGDSTVADGDFWSVFRITALTATPGVFFHSPPDSGYSLDNLAPSVPTNLQLSAGLLSWDPSPAPDFDYFTISGGETPDFGTAVLVGHAVAPEFDVAAAPHAYYFVAATDFAGNQGPAAVLDRVSGVGDTPRPRTLALANHPNPFNPVTMITYAVPRDGPVSLAVYDARGRLVARLVEREPRVAGTYRTRWDGRTEAGPAAASGMYLLRIETGGEVRTRKIVLGK